MTLAKRLAAAAFVAVIGIGTAAATTAPAQAADTTWGTGFKKAADTTWGT